jgi:two-component system chemotaxis sensor kinase CheA
LGVESGRRHDELNIVVLQADDNPFGLVVDDTRDTEEIVVKPLQKQLKAVPVFAGATIMGDGRVALILDVPGLSRRAGVMRGDGQRESAGTVGAAADPAVGPPGRGRARSHGDPADRSDPA